MYEDRTQNYDPEIHEYFVQDTLSHSQVQTVA